MSKPKVIGNGLSPFVRKVRVALAEKGIDYDLDPVIPMAPPEGFEKISPLKKIPVYQVGDYYLPDSSAILAFLERSHPTPALYPSDPQDYGRAIFLEEYADSKLTEATAPFFVQHILRARFLKQPVEEAALVAARDAQKKVFAYLESQLDGREFIVGDRLSVADIAIASMAVNLQHGGGSIDESRYPKLASYVATLHARPSFKALIEEERKAIPPAS